MKRIYIDEKGRLCTGPCETYKVWEEFESSRNGKNGKHAECRTCRQTRNREWYRLKRLADKEQ